MHKEFDYIFGLYIYPNRRNEMDPYTNISTSDPVGRQVNNAGPEASGKGSHSSTTAEISSRYTQERDDQNIGKKVIFLQHGLMGSSDNWNTNTDQDSLGE